MIGSTFGHYRILEKIGQGGMGEVFLADDTSLHRKVALKFLTAELELDTTAHKRLLREARSAAALDHPYICHINEVGEWEGRKWGMARNRSTDIKPLMFHSTRMRALSKGLYNLTNFCHFCKFLSLSSLLSLLSLASLLEFSQSVTSGCDIDRRGLSDASKI